MFFILSKVLWFGADPANFCLGLLVLGLCLTSDKARRWGRRLLVAGTAGLIGCGFLPFGTILLAGLENRFPPPGEMPADPAGIIVLGGAIDQVVSATRQVVSMPASGTRLTESAVLARRFPQTRLIYSGGSGSLVPLLGSEAAEARAFWIALGIAPERITLENQSRNTFENARFSRMLLDPKPDQRWILVTSAFHMPRSVGLFRAAGFSVIPFPVDFRTTGTWRDWIPNASAGPGLERFSFALHEWVGLAAYRLTHKIDDLFPAPRDGG